MNTLFPWAGSRIPSRRRRPPNRTTLAVGAVTVGPFPVVRFAFGPSVGTIARNRRGDALRAAVVTESETTRSDGIPAAGRGSSTSRSVGAVGHGHPRRSRRRPVKPQPPCPGRGMANRRVGTVAVARVGERVASVADVDAALRFCAPDGDLCLSANRATASTAVRDTSSVAAYVVRFRWRRPAGGSTVDVAGSHLKGVQVSVPTLQLVRVRVAVSANSPFSTTGRRASVVAVDSSTPSRLARSSSDHLSTRDPVGRRRHPGHRSPTVAIVTAADADPAQPRPVRRTALCWSTPCWQRFPCPFQRAKARSSRDRRHRSRPRRGVQLPDRTHGGRGRHRASTTSTRPSTRASTRIGPASVRPVR